MNDKIKIPTSYRHFWEPYKGAGMLDHTTTLENWKHIQASGFLEPKDPSPHHWSGIRAVFLSDTQDPLYAARIPRVQAHVRKKGGDLVRLFLAPRERELFKSTDPERTSQVISLDPILVSEVIRVEEIGGGEP